MAAAQIIRIARRLLKNMPERDVKELAQRKGYFKYEKKEPSSEIQERVHEIRPEEDIGKGVESKLTYRTKPKPKEVEDPQLDLFPAPTRWTTKKGGEIDYPRWEREGYAGVLEEMADRPARLERRLTRAVESQVASTPESSRLSQLLLKRSQEAQRQRKQERDVRTKLIDVFEDTIGPPTPVQEQSRLAAIGELASVRPAQQELLNFGKELTDIDVVRAALKAGVYNPRAWEATGLSRWPKELRNPVRMAKMALGITKTPTVKQQKDIRKLTQEMSGIAERQGMESTESLAQKVDLDQLRKSIREEGRPRDLSKQEQEALRNEIDDALKEGRHQPLRGVREVGISKSEREVPRVTRDAGTKGVPITDEDYIESTFEQLGARFPETGPRDEFGRLLPEFKEWSDLHDVLKNRLRLQEQDAIERGLSTTRLSEEAMEQKTRDVLDQDILGYGIPLEQRFRQHIPFKGATPEQTLMFRQETPPTKQDVLRRLRGEEGGSGIAREKSEEEVISETMATDPGMSEMSPLQDVISVSPQQERILSRIFGKEISGIPPREATPHGLRAQSLQAQRQQAEREQLSAGRSAGLRRKLLGQGRRNEAFAYGEPTEVIPPRVERQLEMPLLKEPTPEVVTDLRKRAAEIRRTGNSFRAEANAKIRGSYVETQPATELVFNPKTKKLERVRTEVRAGYSLADVSPQEREKIWEGIRNRPSYKRYVQDKQALKEEIYNKAPDIMEFDEYVRPQRRISRPRQTVKGVPLREEGMWKEGQKIDPDRAPYYIQGPEEQLELKYKERDLSTLLPSELDKAFAAGEININNPKLLARWKADAPRRKATDEALTRYDQKLKKAERVRNKAVSESRIAKLENKFAEEMDAIDAGFITKDKKADVTAWKKAGSPEPLDWKDIDTDKAVRPKQKLVDSFKKGSKVVNRKRGGMIKKPRGWGAARYKGR